MLKADTLLSLKKNLLIQVVMLVPSSIVHAPYLLPLVVASEHLLKETLPDLVLALLLSNQSKLLLFPTPNGAHNVNPPAALAMPKFTKQRQLLKESEPTTFLVQFRSLKLLATSTVVMHLINQLVTLKRPLLVSTPMLAMPVQVSLLVLDVSKFPAVQFSTEYFE